VRLSRQRKSDLLREIPLFKDCSREELELLAALADELALPAGRVLMREGEVGRELVVLVEGDVDITQGGKRVATRSGNDFIGELALVTQKPRSATVTATTALRVLVVSAHDFDRLIDEAPSIAVKVLRAVADRLDPEKV
jgi:CRP/FNR family transcriptional regulator, cyclic AMP receptor protein